MSRAPHWMGEVEVAWEAAAEDRDQRHAEYTEDDVRAERMRREEDA